MEPEQVFHVGVEISSGYEDRVEAAPNSSHTPPIMSRMHCGDGGQ